MSLFILYFIAIENSFVCSWKNLPWKLEVQIDAWHQIDLIPI